MTISDNGSYLTLDDRVDVLKSDIGSITRDAKREYVWFNKVTKPHIRLIKFSELTSPVFSNFSDFSDWIEGARKSTGVPYSVVVDATEATTDEVDVSGLSISQINTLFLNNAFIPAADYTFDGDTISFDGNIDEGDIVTIYE